MSETQPTIHDLVVAYDKARSEDRVEMMTPGEWQETLRAALQRANTLGRSRVHSIISRHCGAERRSNPDWIIKREE